MKNIMLVFLSDIPNKNIKSSKYKISDGRVITTMHTAESAIAELSCKINKIDKIFAFVTDEVARNKELILNDEEKFEAGVLALFKKRVSKDNKYVAEEDIIVCEYSADKNVEDSLDNIALMAHKILQETKKFNGEEVYIHADMTGGLRSASMMMLGIMRFLEFSNYKLGNVLYSNWLRDREINWVENAEGIYRFFDLVAGGKEFTHFGSVKEITAYYDRQDNLSSQCSDLIKAMKNFSENIKLCHYGNFVYAIKALRQAVENFEKTNSEQDNINDKLMKILLPTIKKDYQTLFTSVDDDLSIIKWCVQHDYLQQAMTLYTERVPEYIFAEKILYIMETEKETAQKDYKIYAEKDGGSFNFYCLNVFKSQDEIGEIVKDKVAEKFKEVFKNISRGKYKKELLLKALNEYDYQADDDVAECLQSDFIDIVYNEQAIDNYLSLVRKIRTGNDEYSAIAQSGDYGSKLFRYFLSKRPNEVYADSRNKTAKNFVNFCGYGLDKKMVEEFFSIQIEYKKNYKISMRWRIVKKYLNKIYGSSLTDVDMLKEIINDYNWIKYERNASNHARKGVIEVKAKEIEDKILNGIELLKKVKENV